MKVTELTDVMIPHHIPTFTGREFDVLKEESKNDPSFFAAKKFEKKCAAFFAEQFKGSKLLFTSSCARALELSVMLAGIKPGDEVIMPSYTFVASANAVAQFGGVPVFIDMRPDTLNINEELIEAAITPRTKAIMPVHYGGVGCEMDAIVQIAEKHGLYIIEDAAHGIQAAYKNRPLGSIGHLNCLSFDSMKNISCGEGGLLIITRPELFARAEICYDQGTDRFQFNRGEVPFFQWVDVGSNFKMHDYNAGILWAQLQEAERITQKRLDDWNYYYLALLPLNKEGEFELPRVPAQCQHNAHIFFVRLRDENARNQLLNYLRERKIFATHHYLPLHRSVYGKIVGRFNGEDRYTTSESLRLLRLPLYYDIDRAAQKRVIETIAEFWDNKLAN
ncbi:MAG: dTDP-4-amino-4,6-dideoxygalactose transaminase [Chitinophagales bacterium]